MDRNVVLGAALSLLMHATVLGGSAVACVALGEPDDVSLDEQYLICQGTRCGFDWSESACVSPMCCTPERAGGGPPGALIEDDRQQASLEVRRCFHDDAPPWACLNRPPPELDLRRGAERLGLDGVGERGSRAPLMSERGRPPVVEVRDLSVTGAVTRQDVEEALQRSGDRFLACYERALRDDPSLQGSVTMTLTAGADSVETDVSAAGGAAGHEALLCCVGAVLDGVIPLSDQGGARVRLTLAMRP